MNTRDRQDFSDIHQSRDILGGTSVGLSGTNIIAITTAYAVENIIKIPHQIYPFEAGNKHTALRENLQDFPPDLQFELIRALREHPQVIERNSEAARKLKIQLPPRSGFGRVAARTADPVQTTRVIGVEQVSSQGGVDAGFPLQYSDYPHGRALSSAG